MVSHSGKLGQFNKLTSACSSNSSKVGPNYLVQIVQKLAPIMHLMALIKLLLGLHQPVAITTVLPPSQS